MKVNKRKAVVILTIIVILAQIWLPVFQNVSYAVENGMGWDISISGNGSVVANLDNNGTLNISGTGTMMNWDSEQGTIPPWNDVKQNIIAINIQEGISNIGNEAFIDCEKLTNVNMPETLSSIGKRAFQNCISLEKIEIPKSVLSIGNYAFSKCNTLVDIELPEELSSLGEGTFEGCASLKSMNIPNGVTKIGTNTFAGCTKLSNITISKGVKEIGFSAFAGCAELKDVIISNNVTAINNQVFENCESLNIICNSNSEIEKYARANNISYKNDDVEPRVEFTIEESNNDFITVAVKDNLAGIDENSLKYLWSTKSSGVQINEIKTSFKNSEKISGEKLTGEYYLWVAARDLLGNYTIQNTTGCILDNTLPTITVSQSDAKIIITAADLGAGLNIKNEYQYYISTNDKMFVEGQWNNYESGKSIEVENGRTEQYYVFVKPISDMAGNISDANGTMVTIEEVKYHRFGPYSRNVKNIEFNPNGSEEWIQNIKVEVSGFEHNMYENYKYAWIEESTSLNINDSGDELNCKDFKEDGIVYSDGIESGKYNLVIVEKITGKIIAKTKVFNFTKDVTAPTIKVLYSTEEITNKNVTVKIIANEQIQKIEGWELAGDNNQLIKEYTTNVNEKVIIKDIVGNKVEQEIKVENIDKNETDIEIKYSNTEITNQNVIATITSSKELKELAGWKLSENKKELTKEYEANKKENIIVEDLAGNKGQVQVNIENIDKEPATLQIKYPTNGAFNDRTKVIIMAREKLQPLEGWELSGDQKQLVKEYSQNTEENVTVKDLAGNETTKEISVTNIKKKSSVLRIVFSTLKETQDNVTVVIVSDLELKKIDGWKLSEDKRSMTKVYEKNTEEKLVVKDIYGNEIEQVIKISNINKNKETANKEYITKEEFTSSIKNNNNYVIKENNKKVSKDVLKTGQIIELDNGTIYIMVVKGDLNGDGKVTTQDVSLLNQHRLGKKELVGEYLLAADIIADDEIDNKDMAEINKIRLNKD